MLQGSQMEHATQDDRLKRCTRKWFYYTQNLINGYVFENLGRTRRPPDLDQVD